jgi:hypothetical protein
VKRTAPTPRGDRRKFVVDPETGCHIWIGAVAGSGEGYGYLKVNGKAVRAHRYFYELEVGPVPEGKVLHHHCERRRCVNTKHLEPVPGEVNTRWGRRWRS